MFLPGHPLPDRTLLGLPQSRVVQTLLTLLMVIGSTTTSIQHSHARGRADHTHGFGLTQGLSPAGVDDSGEPARHSHFVLLGVEFYTGENTPTGPGPDAPDRPQTHIGLDEAADSSESVKYEQLDGSQFVVVAVFARSGSSPRSGLPSWQSTRIGLCDRARGERSGVNNC